MTTSSTVLQIKKAALALSKMVPCNSITVSMVIDKIHIARSTFYKYFQNMASVWHALTHDLMHSIGKQLDQLYISPVRQATEIDRQKILTFAAYSPFTMASYFSEFFMQNSHTIQCLIKMDPYFLVHWRKITNMIFLGILQQNGYSLKTGRCIADLISYGLVDKCLLAVQRNDKQLLFDYYLASNNILHALCSQNNLPEQPPKQLYEA